MANRYLTTPIYYVNGRPHIGHLYTTVVTDVFARFMRLRGDRVLFLTGTDEHGQKIEKLANVEGRPPIEIADRNAAAFQALWKKFRISNDDFIRTTEPRHRPAVEELMARMIENDAFFLSHHEGWYCVGCETFYPEKDLKDGRCPTHETTPEWQSQENVFFRRDRYQDRLLDLYTKRPDFVFPQERMNEVLSFVRSGLKPLSVSRTNISWGLPFEFSDETRARHSTVSLKNHPGHVVYVWLDALTNYLSALGFGSGSFEKDAGGLFRVFWPGEGSTSEALHFVGKDILRFHAVYWPAFLIAADVPVPTRVVSHGWWLLHDRKISKSLGNVVEPEDFADRYGIDAFRWHLIAEMAFGQDASFVGTGFLTRYNADLANGLGNTLARALRMAADAFSGLGPAEACDENEVKAAAQEAVVNWRTAFENFRPNEAADAIRSFLSVIDGYIASRQPWKKVKVEGVTSALSRIHYNCLEGLRLAAVLLAPILPDTAEAILARLGISKRVSDLTFGDLSWGGLPLRSKLTPGPPLFPRALLPGPPSQMPEREEKTVNPETPLNSIPEKNGSPVPVTSAEAASARISIDDFQKIDLRVAEIVAAEKVEKSKKLMKMSIRVGEEIRTIVGGIATAYSPEDLVGRKVVIVANLAPAKLMGIESNGMVLAASLPETGSPSLLGVDPSVPSGTRVK